MVLLYSFQWKKIPYRNKYTSNVVKIRITFMDECGKTVHADKLYEEWIGVCTGNIEKVVRDIQTHFPGEKVRYERYDFKLYRKMLPYFEERLQSGKLDYPQKPFYKVYTLAPVGDVGRFFNKRKFTYYLKEDWLIRLSIDLCRDKASYFRYQWYDVNLKEPWLTRALRILPENMEVPRWKITAFDLETVTSYSSRVPTGSDPDDRIVMISLVTWYTDSPQTVVQERVLYLNPCQTETLGFIDPRYVEYSSEKAMLNDFHVLIEGSHILTGYNINLYDITFIFARLMWLGMVYLLNRYTSRNVGTYLVTTFDDKIVVDMMDFFDLRTQHKFSSMKLDVVAKQLLDHGKIPIDAVGIHAYYKKEGKVSRELCLSDDGKHCGIVLGSTEKRFGTFKEYLKYCLVDSDLVRRLFISENAFTVLLSRANPAALDIMQALHFGNTRVDFECFKTFGLRSGFFVNTYHLKNTMDHSKFESVFIDDKYQGALNYCIPEKYYGNVSNLDFTSMYPTIIKSCNICFGTCTILRREEYLRLPERYKLTAIAYRNHSDKDFERYSQTQTYPPFDENDEFVIVINQNTEAFLPAFVDYFLNLRKQHQRLFKETRNVLHHNTQNSIKLLVNSLYGALGSKDSALGYLVAAMSIVTFARYQLLAANHYVQREGYTVCYADTDSLMVHNWPVDHCDAINAFLNLPFVDIKFENRMKSLLVLSKKRYVFETEEGKLVSKGFQKKMNDLVRFMSEKITAGVMGLGGQRGEPSDGWILWVKTLTAGEYMCRDPTKYFIHRKTKNIEEYKSENCASVRYLKKYPEKVGKFVDYAYIRADVSKGVEATWIVDAKETSYVNFEKLFVNQFKSFVLMLNIGFWGIDNPVKAASRVLNTMRWKKFMHAELLNWFQTGKRICIFMEKGVKYTFWTNDYTVRDDKRKREEDEDKKIKKKKKGL